jgi:hypothetical protein
VPHSDVHISIDVEADGPVPGPYSMLALGMSVAGRFDGERFVPADPERAAFYTELRPISETFDSHALRVARVDRDALCRDGPDPHDAMDAAADWVREVSGDDTPVAVCWPLAFDWPFVHYYFVCYAQRPPFRFSACLDMKTVYQHQAWVTIDRAGKDDLPEELRPRRRHTHHARDDAIEQAELWARLVTWPGGRRR